MLVRTANFGKWEHESPTFMPYLPKNKRFEAKIKRTKAYPPVLSTESKGSPQSPFRLHAWLTIITQGPILAFFDYESKILAQKPQDLRLDFDYGEANKDSKGGK